MQDSRKLEFVAHQTKQALDHMTKTPNLVTPKGMSHEKMMAFVEKVTKHGLQHFDAGGTVAPGVSGPAPTVSAPLNTTSGGITGAIGTTLGTQNNFTPGSANIQQGTNAPQLNSAYTGAQTALTDQGNLVTATQPNTNQGLGLQNTLGTQLQNEANGNGPNPAQAALNQETGQNINNEAALLNSQRGASANPGATGLNVAQTSGAIQQQAVGQAATLQAQQQLAAQSEAQGLASTEVNQGATAIQGENNANQNEQNILQGANTASNNATVSSQNNVNTVGQSAAAGNQAQSGNILGGVASGLSSAISSIFAKGGLVRMDKGGKVLDANARKHIAPHNFALPGGRYPIHDINHARNALARVSQNGSPEEVAHVRAAVHKKYPSIGPKKMASGGSVTLTPLIVNNPNGPTSSVGQWLNSSSSSQPGIQGSSAPTSATSNSIGDAIDNATTYGSDKSTDSGNADIGSITNDPNAAPTLPGASSVPDTTIASGSSLPGLSVLAEYEGGLAAKGGNVKANNTSQKATVKGDSLKNDKIPALLSQGEVVMDRDTLADKGPIGQMARAVAAHIAKRNGKK